MFLVNICVPDTALLNVVPRRVTLFTPTLSLTTAVKVTVWVCDEVLGSTVVSLAEKLLIDGSSSSTIILIVTVSVAVRLELSVTVAVNVSLLLPKLRSS